MPTAEQIPAPELIAALRERPAYYREHPKEVATWPEVRARILAQESASNA